jgi:uncharacterized protein (DUF488 family)
MTQKDRKARNPASEPDAVFTVGHGNRSPQAFLDILLCAGIICVVDVRAHPMSRRHPAFSRPVLSPFLGEAGITYRWLGTALGGFRKASPQSPHVALQGEGMRGFAEHMSGRIFLDGIEELLSHARQHATAVLCAERLPRDCHRSLIADHLVARGVPVVHLIDIGHQAPHRLNKLARRQEGRLVYDLGSTEQLSLEW